MFNGRLGNPLQEIRTNSDSMKYLKDNTRDPQKSLIVNQDLTE